MSILDDIRIAQRNAGEEACIANLARLGLVPEPEPSPKAAVAHVLGGAAPLTFDAFREANVTRCLKWHPHGIASWSASDWVTAIVGELGEMASLIKMRNRERDAMPGNKFSPTDEQIGKEAADVLTYLDLFCAAHAIDLGRAAALKFNEVSERVGFPDRIEVSPDPF